LFECVETEIGALLAGIFFEKAAGIFINPELRRIALRLHLEIRVWSFEVEIIMRIRAGHHLLFYKTTRDRQILRVVHQRLTKVHRTRSQSRTGWIAGRVVVQHQRVFVRAVFEVVEDAFFFHQARHEIKSSFVVLHTVVTLVVCRFQIVAKITEPEIGKDSLDDVGHALVLKDTAIASLRQQPKPGMNVREVTREAKVCLFQNETPDDPVEAMLGVVAEIECYGHGFADDRLKVDGVIFRNHLECELKQARDSLFAAE